MEEKIWYGDIICPDCQYRGEPHRRCDGTFACNRCDYELDEEYYGFEDM